MNHNIDVLVVITILFSSSFVADISPSPSFSLYSCLLTSQVISSSFKQPYTISLALLLAEEEVCLQHRTPSADLLPVVS